MCELANILVVDRNRLFREGLRRILSNKRFAIHGDTNSFAEALEVMRAAAQKVDLIIGDPGEDWHDDYQAIATLRHEYQDLKIVILTDRPTAAGGEFAVQQGLSGVLSKDLSAGALKHSLELVLMGATVIPLAVMRTQAGQSPAAVPEPRTPPCPHSEAEPVECEGQPCGARQEPTSDDGATAEAAGPGDTVGLSGREYEILKCLVSGMSNKLIARHLDMAEATVKVHLRTLLRKLKAQNRTQAAIWAMKNGSSLTRPPRSDIRRQGAENAMVRFDALASAFNRLPM